MTEAAITPILYNAPTDVPMWLMFGAVHQTDHFQIAGQIWQKKQLLVPVWPIDPIPLADPEAMLTWFENHQAAHNLMNDALGVGGFDLSYADFSSPERFAVWIEYNAYEHQRAASVIAGLQPPQSPTVPVSVLQGGTPVLPWEGVGVAPSSWDDGATTHDQQGVTWDMGANLGRR